MKRACILYKRSDAQKNGVLINKYFNAVSAFGLVPGLVITDRLGNDEVLAMTDGAELVVNRTRDSGLAAFLERRGLRVTNPSGKHIRSLRRVNFCHFPSSQSPSEGMAAGAYP